MCAAVKQCQHEDYLALKNSIFVFLLYKLKYLIYQHKQNGLTRSIIAKYRDQSIFSCERDSNMVQKCCFVYESWRQITTKMVHRAKSLIIFSLRIFKTR